MLIRILITAWLAVKSAGLFISPPTKHKTEGWTTDAVAQIVAYVCDFLMIVSILIFLWR